MELFCFKNIAHHFRMKGKTWAIPKDDIIISVDGHGNRSWEKWNESAMMIF